MTVTEEGETRMTVRLPDKLLARLRQAAAHDRRSVHAEMLWLLEHALDARDGSPSSGSSR
jgi:plasmid stability protein